MNAAAAPQAPYRELRIEKNRFHVGRLSQNRAALLGRVPEIAVCTVFDRGMIASGFERPDDGPSWEGACDALESMPCADQMPWLQHGDGRRQPAEPRRHAGDDRHLSCVSGVLVRRPREPAALARRGAEAVSCDRRARGGAAATSIDSAGVPPMRPPFALHNDQQRNTKFQYLRCARGDGRLITFVDFLREKDFITAALASADRGASAKRPGGQLLELRRADRSRRTSSACAHCGSPRLDARHEAGGRAGRCASRIRAAAARSILRCRCASQQARREVETAFASFDRGPGWFDDVARRGLVAAGLSSLARWLKSI